MNIINESMAEQARKYYDWYTVDKDSITATFQSRILKHEKHSVYSQEVSFHVDFSAADILGQDGKNSWPLSGEFICFEKPSRLAILAKSLIVSGAESARCASYRGVYSPADTRFTLDAENPKDILFVSDKRPRSIYGCDVFYIYNAKRVTCLYAMPIPLETARRIINDNRFIA